jgi:EmrB/QacA subfamily drug resistance transporter
MGHPVAGSGGAEGIDAVVEIQEEHPLAMARRRRWAMGAMCLALSMIMLDMTAVNVALPAIQQSLQTSTVTLQWIVNGYTLSLAVLLVTGGRLGDLFGRRRLFIIGIVIFAAASAAIGFAPSALWTLAWRIVQGLGAALLMPATLSIITNMFAATERGRAIGIWTGVSAVSLAVGPMAGGLLVENVGWRSIFFINPFIAAGTVAVALRAVRESRDETAVRTVDIPGLIALTVGLGALMVGLVQVNNWHLTSTREIGLFALSLASLASFIVIEMHHRAPMVDFGLFRSRVFVGAIVMGFVAFFALFGVMLYSTLYMQNIRGYSPFQTGIRFLPAIVMVIVISPFSGRLADRVGPRLPVTVGMAVLAGSLLLGTLITVTSSYLILFMSLTALGLGVGLALPPLSTATMNSVGEAKAGVASGIMTMFRMVGGTLGAAIMGVLIVDLWSKKLGQLLPFLPPGAGLEIVNRPPTSKALEVFALPEQIYNGKEAFVYAYQHTVRLAAALPAVGALLAWILLARPQTVAAESPGSETKNHPDMATAAESQA